MSILIAVPTFESVKTDTYLALWSLDRAGQDARLAIVKGYDCAIARTEIARRAVAGGHSHVLMVDSDTVPPPDALANLLGDGHDVCLGYYVRRGHRTQTAVQRLDGDPFHVGELQDMAERGEAAVRAKCGGLGCALIKSDVFRRIAQPWFRYEQYGNGSALSEDYWFCRACREAGIPIYVDTRVRCRHVVEQVL
ncbi:MAG: glycosyltransferase [Kiritimatiellae bacterium]|nr:glycosyltransferase [Kiritimatiellia bacterium]